MKQTAQVIGKVEHREGDGSRMLIRPGAVEVETTAADATLSWKDGKTRGAAAIPIADFRRYVAEGAIQLRSAA
jgi:hypothetical protein